MHACVKCEAPFEGPSWSCPACGFAPERNGYLRFAPDFAGNEGFLEESFDHLEDVEDASFWFRARNELIAWALRSHFPAATSLLEVGCGTGYVAADLRRRLPGLRVAAGDPFDAGVRVAQRRLPDAELFQMDGRRIPFYAEFDVVAAFDVLEHVREHDLVVEQMCKAVVPGGGVLVTVPQHRWLWTPLDDYAQHVRRYTRPELRSVLESAGLRVLRMTSFVSLLLPLLLASRLRQRRKPVDPRSEFDLPPAVDRGLAQVMALELRLIARGISFPGGGSLLAIAVRPSAPTIGADGREGEMEGRDGSG
jgi:SAM-dependent methyltransferase